MRNGVLYTGTKAIIDKHELNEFLACLSSRISKNIGLKATFYAIFLKEERCFLITTGRSETDRMQEILTLKSKATLRWPLPFLPIWHHRLWAPKGAGEATVRGNELMGLQTHPVCPAVAFGRKQRALGGWQSAFFRGAGHRCDFTDACFCNYSLRTRRAVELSENLGRNSKFVTELTNRGKGS
jgi:hypothetical protein